MPLISATSGSDISSSGECPCERRMRLRHLYTPLLLLEQLPARAGGGAMESGDGYETYAYRCFPPGRNPVVVVDGSRVEDYDVEVASRRQLKGNIYLAKVTRVEPSLQAAFVEYGGNRHGFLAFNEIHPDYYQIPIADRERLLAEQAAAEREAESDREDAEADAIVADEDEDVERRRARLSSRYYKIQEVIKRRQIMLVQVAKEERGNKGGAYYVFVARRPLLRPDAEHLRGGGISRKIAGITDRKRLKKIIAELDVPEGMAVIVRTAVPDVARLKSSATTNTWSAFEQHPRNDAAIDGADAGL